MGSQRDSYVDPKPSVTNEAEPSGRPLDEALRVTAAELGHGRAAYDIVADTIERLIAVGGLRPGDRLPPERELAPMLGSARITVRQAIKRLTAQGLVTTTRGRNGGTFVARALTSQSEAMELSAEFKETIDRAFEYRHILEPPAARLAAKRATRADRDALVLLAEQPSDAHSTFHDLDTKFHLIIARASGLPDLREAIEKQRAKFFVLANAVFLPTSAADFPSFAEEHREIALAIQEGDELRAGVEMEAHLDRSHGQFSEALARATAGVAELEPGK